MNMLLKPETRTVCNLFECAGLFEEMRGARHGYQTFRAGKKSVGRSIHFDNRLVISANNQQRRCPDRREIRCGQIRSTAP